MMPTTRYGRFLLYRSRAKKRLRKAERRRAQHHFERVAVTTGIVTDGREKQMPRRSDGPRHVGQNPEDFDSPSVTLVPAEYRRPAVLKFTAGAGNPIHPTWHPRDGMIHYQNRRVFWLPHLRQLTRYYPMPRPSPADKAAYPFAPYPSGERNPFCWIGRDGFGRLPDGWIGWNGPGWIVAAFSDYYATPTAAKADGIGTEPGSDPEWAFW